MMPASRPETFCLLYEAHFTFHVVFGKRSFWISVVYGALRCWREALGAYVVRNTSNKQNKQQDKCLDLSKMDE